MLIEFILAFYFMSSIWSHVKRTFVPAGGDASNMKAMMFCMKQARESFDKDKTHEVPDDNMPCPEVLPMP